MNQARNNRDQKKPHINNNESERRLRFKCKGNEPVTAVPELRSSGLHFCQIIVQQTTSRITQHIVNGPLKPAPHIRYDAPNKW